MGRREKSRKRRTGISGLSRERHQRMLVQSPRLVIRSFENGGSSHCGFGGCDEGEVLAGDAQ